MVSVENRSDLSVGRSTVCRANLHAPAAFPDPHGSVPRQGVEQNRLVRYKVGGSRRLCIDAELAHENRWATSPALKLDNWRQHITKPCLIERVLLPVAPVRKSAPRPRKPRGIAGIPLVGVGVGFVLVNVVDDIAVVDRSEVGKERR